MLSIVTARLRSEWPLQQPTKRGGKRLSSFRLEFSQPIEHKNTNLAFIGRREANCKEESRNCNDER